MGTELELFLGWALGGSTPNRNYGPGNVETQEMEKSPGVGTMRDQFYKNGCKTLNVPYDTYRAYWDTIVNPFTAKWSSTAAEVGGWRSFLDARRSRKRILLPRKGRR